MMTALKDPKHEVYRCSRCRNLLVVSKRATRIATDRQATAEGWRKMAGRWRCPEHP